MTEEFEKDHLWELSRNCFINKVINFIDEQPKVCEMNDKWKRIIKKWIECYEAINTLWIHSILNDNEYSNFQAALLERIVDSFKNEVEE